MIRRLPAARSWVPLAYQAPHGYSRVWATASSHSIICAAWKPYIADMSRCVGLQAQGQSRGERCGGS